MPDSNPGSAFAETLRARIEAALAERDRPGAVQTALSAVHDGSITIPSLYVDVLSPLLAGIGSAWSHGNERVWEEHYATHTVRTIVESLYLDVQRLAADVERRGAERPARVPAQGAARTRPPHALRPLRARRLRRHVPRRRHPARRDRRRRARHRSLAGRAVRLHGLRARRAAPIRRHPARTARQTCASSSAGRRSHATSTGRPRTSSIPTSWAFPARHR